MNFLSKVAILTSSILFPSIYIVSNLVNLLYFLMVDKLLIDFKWFFHTYMLFK